MYVTARWGRATAAAEGWHIGQAGWFLCYAREIVGYNMA